VRIKIDYAVQYTQPKISRIQLKINFLWKTVSSKIHENPEAPSTEDVTREEN